MATQMTVLLWLQILYAIYQDPSPTNIYIYLYIYIYHNCTTVDVPHIGKMNILLHAAICPQISI